MFIAQPPGSNGAPRIHASPAARSSRSVGKNADIDSDLGVSAMVQPDLEAMLPTERGAADGVLDEIHLRYGVHGAEPWSESFRQKLQAAWGGEYDACDIYGLSEVIGPGVAMECREGKGALHVFDDHFYPEVIDVDRNEPAAEGTLGELVLTTLTKEALPVIRYRTGDVTKLVDEPCACGRTHRRIARFTGRVDDMLVIRGVNVFPSEIEAVLLEDQALGGQYAIVIDRTGTLPQLEVRAEVASVEFTARKEEIAGRLQERLAQRLRLRVQAIVGEPETIPRQETGKAKRVFERTADQEPFPRPNELGNT